MHVAMQKRDSRHAHESTDSYNQWSIDTPIGSRIVNAGPQWLSRSPPPCTSIRQVGKMTIFAGASRWFQMRFFYVFLLSKLQGCTKSMCSIVFWVGWNMLEQTKRIHVARRGTSWRPCWFTWCCWAVAGLMSIWSQACRFKTFGGALARVEPPLW